ncbi:MAG: hypothetical protein KAQ99_01605 [Candidatus Aureabacteria bacterium]|nr:hypothetical protein [Candidatus Auribacterota bacterium]
MDYFTPKEYALWDLKLQRAKLDFFYFMDQCLGMKEIINEYLSTIDRFETRYDTDTKTYKAVDLPPLEIKEYGWHLKHWSRLVHQYRYLLLRAPRDHWKTSWFTIGFPLWRALRGEPGYLISITNTLGWEKGERLKNFIDRNAFLNPKEPELRKLLPTRIRPTSREGWGKEQIRFANGAKIDIAGFRTATRGPHPKYIILDDVHGETQNYSMDYARDHFKGTIYPMLPEGGYMIIIGTSFQLNDLYHYLSDKENSSMFQPPLGYAEILQAVTDYDAQKVLWDAWYTFKRLMRIRGDIGVLVFNREYQNEAISEETSLFPMGIMTPCFDRELGLTYEYTGDLPVFCGWDLAIGTTEEADFTVGFAVALDKMGNRFILDIIREHGIGYEAQWGLVENMANRFKPQLINIEANAYQRALPDEMRRRTDLPIEPYTTGSEKHSLEVGILSLRKLFENEKFKLPRANERSKVLTDRLLFELHALVIENGKVKTTADHDDMALALWITNQAIEQWKEWAGWFSSIDLDVLA